MDAWSYCDKEDHFQHQRFNLGIDSRHCRLDTLLRYLKQHIGSVGFILVLMLFLIYATISNRWLSTTTGVIMAFTGYWLAGISFLIFPFLIVAIDLKKGRLSLLKWMVIGGLVFSIPCLLYTS